MLLSIPRLVQPALWALFAALWAGASLAGNLVAAPAKFQVEALELSVALQVGRAQFSWIGIVEWVFVVLIVAILVLRVRTPPVLLFLAVMIFLSQQFWLQPLMEARSDLLISGQSVPDSHLHVVFAGLEALKFLALLMYSATSIWSLVYTATADRDEPGVSM